MNLGKVARTPWVTRLASVTDEADRLFSLELVRSTRDCDPILYPF